MPTGLPANRILAMGIPATRSGEHVGGGMRPPADHTVALSDGTHISFGSVEEVPLLEDA